MFDLAQSAGHNHKNSCHSGMKEPRMEKAFSSSTSSEMTSSTNSSESEELSQRSLIEAKLSGRSLPITRKSLSHTSVGDFRALPQLSQRLGNMWEKRFHTDVIFQVGALKEIVEAHRIILSSSSYIFERLFYESTQKPLILAGKFVFHEPDYSLLAFKIFIKAMYTNEFPTNLNLTTALEIFYAAKKYQVLFLQQLILSHILQTISVENVFEALKVSTNAIELTDIVPICWKLIEEETSNVLATHLDHLDEHTLTKILTRDHLNLEEVELFQYLVRWGAIQCKRRGLKTTGKNKRQMIDHLLKYIRFTTMSSMDFNDIVIPSRILEQKEIIVLQSHISPAAGAGEPLRTSLPYNARPRFKPKVPVVRKPESLQSNNVEPAHYEPNLDAHSDSEVQVPSKPIKLRPKSKSSRKASRLKVKHSHKAQV